MSGVGRLLSEEMRRAVGTILEAGFQMESEAFKTLVEKGREDSLRPLVDEVLKMASSAQPRPLFISADLVLKAAEQLDLTVGLTVPVQEGLDTGEDLPRIGSQDLKWFSTQLGNWERPGSLTI